MGNLWLKIKIWFKVALVAILVIYIILFTYNNASEKTHFWYWFHHAPETTLLFLVLCAFFAGVVSSLLIRTTFRTVRQIQEMQQRSRTQRLGREIDDIKTKAAMLQTKPSGAQSASSDVRQPPAA
jgi:H+/Cl- antiporter ClcA